jgi:hypothetical protein
MNNRILFLILIGVLFSCNKNDDTDKETEEFGNWILVEMNGSIPNSETTGSDMEWQEIYSLNTDGTFQKSRDRDGSVTKVFGT